MDTFAQPTGDDREFAEDGTPIAHLTEDPATTGKWTQPYLPDADVQPNPVPTPLAAVDLDHERVRAELLGVPAANLDDSDRPHFLRNIDGRELCGQDGQAWPCDQYQRMLTEDQRTNELATLVPSDGLVRIGDVAAALGLTPQELANRMGFPPSGDPAPLPDTDR